jgi:hypothetical protein
MGIFSREKSKTTQQLADEQANWSSSTAGPANTVPVVFNAGPATDRVSLSKSKGATVLLTKFDKAAVSIAENDLTGLTGDALFFMDNSLSMKPDYENTNKVQLLAERAVAWSLNVDSDGEVPIYAWDTVIHEPVIATADNIEGIVNREIYGKKRMGNTNLVNVLNYLINVGRNAERPVFAFIITDGNPNRGSEGEVIRRTVELSRFPVWIKFIAIKPVPFLAQLDDLADNPNSGMMVDNVDTQVEYDPEGVTDLIFARKMTTELPGWITGARAAGILS